MLHNDKLLGFQTIPLPDFGHLNFEQVYSHKSDQIGREVSKNKRQDIV